MSFSRNKSVLVFTLGVTSALIGKQPKSVRVLRLINTVLVLNANNINNEVIPFTKVTNGIVGAYDAYVHKNNNIVRLGLLSSYFFLDNME